MERALYQMGDRPIFEVRLLPRPQCSWKHIHFAVARLRLAGSGALIRWKVDSWSNKFTSATKFPTFCVMLALAPYFMFLHRLWLWINPLKSVTCPVSLHTNLNLSKKKKNPISLHFKISPSSLFHYPAKLPAHLFSLV